VAVVFFFKCQNSKIKFIPVPSVAEQKFLEFCAIFQNVYVLHNSLHNPGWERLRLLNEFDRPTSFSIAGSRNADFETSGAVGRYA
jgi:hypothetical protein